MRRVAFTLLLVLGAALLVTWLSPVWLPISEAQQPAAVLDPAAWGSDHVGRPLPEYIEGGECLFCHRADVGERWGKDRHNLTIRDAGPEEPTFVALAADANTRPMSAEVELVMGDGRQTRFLKRSPAYGKLELLSVHARPGRGKRALLTDVESPHWDARTFGDRCAGCHATGVDSTARIFSGISLDCYVCHGDAPLDHANNPQSMPLAMERGDPPRVIASICGQCHIRGGKSRSTGLPYADNFVAGDNLFRDLQVDWSQADDPQLNPSDRHVLDNIRGVVLHGREEMTCLTCHDVHGRSTVRHRQLDDQKYCGHCHQPGQPKSVVLRYEVHSGVCGY
jgi:hypothetical protein